jgi:hypothetical protein
MSRLEIPLQYRTLWSTGDILVRAELDLVIKTNKGTWEEVTFRADPGTEMTTMQVSQAKDLDLPFPKLAVPNLSMRGQGVRAGYIRAQVLGMDGTEHVFPCYFLGDPNAQTHPAVATTSVTSLLGLTGVINLLRISFDGSPGPGAPYGHLILEKK